MHNTSDIGEVARAWLALDDVATLAQAVLQWVAREIPHTSAALFELHEEGENELARVTAAGSEKGESSSFWLMDALRRVGRLELASENKSAAMALIEPALPWISLALSNAQRISARRAQTQVLEQTVQVQRTQLAAMESMFADSLAAVAEADNRKQQADRQRTEFFTNASHELRTPATLMLGQLERLARLENLSEPAQRSLKSALRGGYRMIKIINDLLDLSKIEAGRMQLQLRVVSAKDLVDDVVAPFAEELRERGVLVAVEAESSLEFVADPERVEQILLNLVANAARHVPDEGRLRISAARTTGGISLEVENTGEGLQPEDIHEIFERFGQSTTSTKRRFGSSGLGLPLTKDLVSLHGGVIEVDNHPGERVLFRVLLPEQVTTQAPSDRAEVPRADSREIQQYRALATSRSVARVSKQSAGQKPSIVVAEDNPELREFLVETLAADYSVYEARDGEEALDLVRKSPPDLVLSDVMMPRLSGADLCRLLKSEPDTSSIPVILLTARSDLESRVTALDLGADDYIIKPFHAEEVGARLRAQLRLRNLTRQVAHREKLAALGTLVAGVAHEVRNPLNGILNSLLPVVELLPPTSPAEVRELLELAVASTRRIEQISSQLLTQARAGEGIRSLFDLAENLKFALRMIAHKAENGPQLISRVPDEKILIVGEPGSLSQVWINLLDNAIAATGITGKVELRVGRDRERVTVEVWNSGAAIPKHVRERIFDPFFTTKPVGQGTGLGLSVVRDVVTSHSGSIEVESDSETGTLFRVVLPTQPVK